MKGHKLFQPKDLKRKLSENNYKMTPQRMEILQVFVDKHSEKHLSAEEVHEILQNRNFDFGLATVYRNVELLTELGILAKVDFGDGRARYELSTTDPEVHNHHHLICMKCKKVIEFEEDLLDELEDFISKSSGFKIVNHEVKFFGYCEKCRNKIYGR